MTPDESSSSENKHHFFFRMILILTESSKILTHICKNLKNIKCFETPNSLFTQSINAVFTFFMSLMFDMWLLAPAIKCQELKPRESKSNDSVTL